MMQEAMKFAKFDALKSQGQTTDLPGSYDTILQDRGGMRSWLYDHDLWFRAQSVNTFSYDVAKGKSSKDPHVFSGQKPTGGTSNEARMSWKFAGTDEDVTQLNVGFQVSGVTLASARTVQGLLRPRRHFIDPVRQHASGDRWLRNEPAQLYRHLRRG
ncbi:hypothetical protein Q4F19_08845 [Sphingomonas sp. BIUV-7]|uniref:Uncharacterized protein n=1 Tax=Sphingomonas natans TaxID=3063330 RepID=A0ABT8Y848_9SPHN|nr:hypothetical protein [Sphingomonas sp. BIUV-7]MDO6414485.1 hypothetical protein [Sphingomonas sp. BIUV-7]